MDKKLKDIPIVQKASEHVGYYHGVKYSSMHRLNSQNKMHGVKRVIIFCILIVFLPATLIIIPLYLRHSIFVDVVYPVAESDIIEIREGISTIFCQQHSLRMNSSFNAFQLQHKPEISTNHKHIRLKKSMTLPDDTLEYWGFYLLKGAKVELKVCSRYEGSRILVVKGERNLRTCGLLEHNKNKVGTHFAEGHEKVQVTFETVAEIVESNENHKQNQSDQVDQQSKKANYDRSKLSVEDDTTGDHAGEDLSEDNNNEGGNNGDGILDKYKLNNNNNNQNKNSSRKSIKKEEIKSTDDEAKEEDIDNKTENVISSRTLGKIHETDTDKNAIKNDSRRHNIEIGKGGSSDVGDYQPKIRHRRHYERNLLKLEPEHHQQHQNDVDDDNNDNPLNNLYNTNRMIKNSQHKLHRRSSNDAKMEFHDHNRQKQRRQKRDHVYDRKISHGGNALNFTDNDSESVSSFENSLLTCYDGQILLAEGFAPSSLCSSVRFLENGTHMVTTHEVVEDGYYYYIFYSDNDIVRNDIHAVFDIHKPTFQYSNVTESKYCVNTGNCTFPIKFLSDEIVIVEVPTRDGIEHDDDDKQYLISTCHPRMSVYIIFPTSVLFLILSCAFI